MSELLDKAIKFATDAHSGQKRKMEKIPYILHPMEVASIASSMTNDEAIMIAGLLHDVVEDTDTEMSTVEAEFGERVAELVASETEDKRADRPPEDTWKIRKNESLCDLRESTDIGVKILWLSDKLSNMRALYRSYRLIGDKAFDYFHMKDKKMQAWYYYSIAEYTSVLSNTYAYEEYTRLVNAVFGEKED